MKVKKWMITVHAQPVEVKVDEDNQSEVLVSNIVSLNKLLRKNELVVALTDSWEDAMAELDKRSS